MRAEDKRSAIINSMRSSLGHAFSASAGQAQQPKEPVTATQKPVPEPVAIIGLAGYLPQSEDVHAFWKALDKDACLLEEIPQSRIDWKNIYDPGSTDPGKSHTKWGGLIPDIRCFDAPFFGILPGEADLMDPRKRLLLMSVYHALEDAGYAPRSLTKETVGVFVAVEEDEYRQCLVESGIDSKVVSGNSSALIANQLSYFFDFRGPSEVVNTMCSGAAVAIHRAAKALQSGEISYAVVAAANILLHPDPFVFLSRTGQMSPVNTVHSFGKEANGFLRADGVGAVILKPLSKAVENKDAIYAVIKNTAVNYNGRGGMSMAAPNVQAHTQVIRTCYEEAGIDPRQVGYIEAQGMGNPVADIAEWEAFNKALKALAKKKEVVIEAGNCRVSTLKPMLGHMHAASALGALFKIIRSFQTNTVHKIPGLTAINPDLATAQQPCRLLTQTEQWPQEGFARLAGLHSYGSGGNNAHILVEEYKDPYKAIETEGQPEKVIVPCSTATKEQCNILVRNLAEVVRQQPAYSLADIAYTMQTGRDAMKYRVAFVVNTRNGLLEQANAYSEGNILEGILEGAIVTPVAATAIDFNDLDAVAKAWINGVDISWSNLSFKSPVRHLHLPVYPFKCNNHWMNNYTAVAPAIDHSSTQAEQIIRHTLSFFLRVAPETIDLQEEFSSLGFDSLLVTNLTQWLEQQYALKLEAAIFFEHTTPAQLIAFISEQFRHQPAGNNNTGNSKAKTIDNMPVAAGKPTGEKEPVAIIGLAGSFPQSSNIELFWKNIIAGKNCVEEIPAERWLLSQHFHPDKEIANKTGKSYGKWGGFMKDLYFFDPLFFNISPAEAAAMNPKERLFLQCAWHTLEDAGYTPRSLSQQRVGVFAGVTRSGLDPYKVSMFPIANRVSYTFNFRGPSIAIDTACSSSLVAVYEACQHIHAGECTVAIAGGVHVFLDPSHFAVLSGMHMLSPEGISKSFGDEANGMVPGEGVGAILLKPLKKALADRDHIYGVIRGAATNHGGKANGFTVPNPGAHAELIQNALKKANVHPRAINYIEAHGTGTSLGDPVEIRGLAEAFKKGTPDTQYCPIGSIKSNIGHLEAAAGISGLAKILLQMKHGKLAPSLHAKKLNPRIDFSQTPFYVQQEAADWQPVDANGNNIPRMACLSSFGAGGSNAHIVIEEYAQKQACPFPASPVMIILSASSTDQVKEKAKQLLSFLKEVEYYDGLLQNIAYTLQVGREAMDERLAVEATSPDELKQKLTLFINGAVHIDKLYTGNARKYKETEKITIKEVKAGDYGRLLSAWVKGAYFDWNKLYQGTALLPGRISLPVYPFLKEYFGLPDAGNGSLPVHLPLKDDLHPLVQRNSSTFSEQKFSSTFNGTEFFLRDHVVNGQPILPAVAYLEMVYVAAGLAAGENHLAIHVKNVAWSQPVVVVHQAVHLNISLLPVENSEANFEIYSKPAGTSPSENNRVHSQGTVQFVEKRKAPFLDIEVLKNEKRKAHFTGADCYRVFNKMGIAYGPSHQVIEYISVGEEDLLAKLSLPAAMAATLHQFYMHPGVMDAAFQAVIGYMIAGHTENEAPLPLAIPFALEELKVFDKCTENMWAHIRYCKRNEQQSGPQDINNLLFDIDVCNEYGQVCVQVKGFTSRILQKRNETPGSNSLLFLQPSWQQSPLVATGNAIQYEAHVVLYAQGLMEAPVNMAGIRLIPLPAKQAGKDALIIQYTLQVFNEVQRLLSAKPKGRLLLQVLITAGQQHEVVTAVAGLLKTAHMENPQFTGQVIMIEEGTGTAELALMIKQNGQQSKEQEIKYVGAQRFTFRLHEYMPGKAATHSWKEQGVYLITGGAGGLGLVLASDIALHAKGAVLILTGRTALQDEKIKQIDNIRALGVQVQYLQVNMADENETTCLVQNILAVYGRIDIVIHAAGVLRDNYIIKKTEKEIREVLAPKVQGLVNLDEATKHLPLERFIVFSSLAGVMGNAGQADYAVANAFLDGYAQYRNTLVAAGKRKGFTTAVNWPLWKEGGMQVREAIEKDMRDTIGMHPLETTAGLDALHQIIASGQQQMMVVAGNLKLLRGTFLEQPPAEKNGQQQKAGGTMVPVEGLKEKAIFYFKKLLSGVIKLTADRIDADTSMDEYGIDSIMVMKLTNELEKVFGSLPKTLFFEYQNIHELTDYFLTSYTEKLAVLLGRSTEETLQQHTDDRPGFTAPENTVSAVRKNRFAAGSAEKKKEETGLEIAIIGLSGRYPQASNLQEFWNNLYNGRNCVTEVPEDRWDHSLYFDSDKSKPGKTYTKWGGFVQGVDEFDPLFFNISPKEAVTLDPQERLFLQCAYELLEDAGYTRDALAGNSKAGAGNNIGVYVGVMWEEYHLYAAQETARGRPMVLSSSPSSIANRVSYFFNFNGPSIAVDTMCSSSLTSIHLACQSLQQGECEVALAGGVNVSIHPNKYLVLGYGRYASSKGLCESFGAGGDGYVAGEGVGAVLLKPLSKAIADNDQIYGVIKGTAVNHGGKVNGFSVPSPKAQSSVIDRALTMAGFSPRTISYLEAHGTGTSLGDPIEIAALSKAFNTQEKKFCAIGSAKSNIGHCESAAGIAGVTKVLLQMKHRQLVPSLHSATLNPHIDFENSPFIVQQELAEWKRPIIECNGQPREFPRRAGISSFGAGGSNAHVVIEEYIAGEYQAGGQALPVNNILPGAAMVVLSAKSEDRLKEVAIRLLTAIQSKTYTDNDLPAIAYTLQVGREAMEERLALEVTSMHELEEKLRAFTQGEEAVENLYLGKVKAYKEVLSFFTFDEDMDRTVESWLKKKKYTKLLALWVNGFDVDWKKLYADPTYRLPPRISLPAYPFMRNRYWPKIGYDKPAGDAGSGLLPVIHPLLHRNTSTFAEQKFSTTFTGEEFFLKDHLVNGEKLLPGVAYLEMVNEAMAIASGQNSPCIGVENIVWAQPLMVNGHPEKVNIRLTPQESGEVAFAIVNQPDAESTSITYSRGMARYVENVEPPLMDIEALLQEVAAKNILPANVCYELFARMGIVYGPAQRAIECLYIGEAQVLARLKLPAVVARTLDQYCLHPSLMDASLQAVIGFLANQYTATEAIPLAIPFAIKSVTVFSRCTADMWAFIRHSGTVVTEKSMAAGQLSFDIDVCDASGKVCVQIREFTSRIIRKGEDASKSLGMLLMEPYWKRQEIVLPQQAVPYAQHLVVVIENDALAATLSTQWPHAKVIHLQATYSSIDTAFENYAVRAFTAVKQLLASKIKSKVLVQVVTPYQEEKLVFAAIAALLKTAQFENPLFTGQVISMEQGQTAAGIITRLHENSRGQVDAVIRYHDGNREVACLREYIPAVKQASPVWEEGGVYLVTGGAGGLGLIFLEEIARTVKNATVVLTGRSLLNEERKNQLKEIRSRGLQVHYRQADVADYSTVERLVQNILQDFGKLTGIIHSAGVVRDSFILRKPEEQVREVLAPKVKGLVNLDLATRQIPLHFFIACSSSAGITGNMGQADYAMANAYMDQYAAYRKSLVLAKQRSGKTLSVNWPLWKEGGIQVTQEKEKMLLQSIGMVAMETRLGLDALYHAMAADVEQMMVMQGELAKLRATFLEKPAAEKIATAAIQEAPVDSKDIHKVATNNKTQGKIAASAYLKEILSEVIHLPAAQINAEKPMEEYGIDSVMVLQMTDKLEKVFGSLSKTLFFEYQSIVDLADYFFDAFPEKFEPLLVPGSTDPVVTFEKKAQLFKSYNRLADAPVKKPERKTVTDALDIAVIGLAGRYPRARDLQAFWQVLKTGTNCITEIPKTRWDPAAWFDQDKNKPGTSNSKWGGFLDGVDEFDPLFFGISAKEAEVLDPQERLFLQCAWETLEDAGYTKATAGQNKALGITGNVGVYVGVMWDEYQLYGAQETALGKPLALSGVPGSIANRVSYFCNFNGPSLALNTMCSSSLTAIHLACQSIQQGECEAAIAGGVNVTLHPNKYRVLAYGSFLSGKGLCESFGAGGDGYVPGEGVGAVLLKPLTKAIADHDHIYGVIKGSSVNHGGKTNGYTVPNPRAQASLIERAIKMAGFDPATISYLEAHGTGTALGDPIEITGLNKAFGTKEKHFCAIGSVKSNIGHGESASGIAGLTKVLLQMKYRQLVPSLHSKVLNPHIDFDNSPFVVQQELAEWKRPVLTNNGQTTEYPLRAGLSSFGAGGSNAHLLIEEYSPQNTTQLNDEAVPVNLPAQNHVLIVLSARNEVQLKQQAERLLTWVKEQAQPTAGLLTDMAYTLQAGREAMKERLAVKLRSFHDLETTIEKYLTGEPVENLLLGRVYDTREEWNGMDAEETSRRIDTWIARQEYDNLLNAWVKGVHIDWNKLYVNGKANTRHPQRISLPVYPFARERYWFSQTAEIRTTMHKPSIEYVLPPTAPQAATLHDELLLEKIVYKLKALFAGIVQYSIDHIDEKDLLENYGIDSVMIVKLNSQLSGIYGELPATLFYEYQTLDALAGYLTNDHRPASMKWAGIDSVAENTAVITGNTSTVAPSNGHARPEPARQIKFFDPQHQEAIAIIGMSGRYPGADNLDEYWENLKAGKDCITEIPGDRWRVDDFFHADNTEAASLGKSYGKWGGFINGFADFDPRFFNISPKEAIGTDPQIRLFIESCWQVLEDAGYTKQSLTELYNGNVGVFAGITRAGFSFYAPELLKMGQYSLNTMSAVANRVSYTLNLKGPSVPVDTMCSSSLTAIHEACESLLRGRCHMAIAGGVNLLLHPSEYVILSANNFLATDGRCRSFGAGGSGYVPGEGVGTVLLKSLSKAIADNDHIYAVIKGTSINHGGKTNGYTVPNPVAHSELIRSALDTAGVNARAISYIEAHGTGTSLGDPIEITGLTQAFKTHTADTQYCSIGSAKSNIGHLEAAAGIAGLAKIVLQMKHRQLVPSLHAKELNPHINFERSPFFVQQTLSEWTRPVMEINGEKRELPRIAGISSFGAGGSNAHVILEEYIPATREKNTNRYPAVVLLSASNENRLKAYAKELLAALQQGQYTEAQLLNIAYTLQVGREAMDARLALEVKSISQLIDKLQAFINEQQTPEAVYTGKVKEHKETISLLTSDKEIAVAVNAWIAGKKYSKLMALWVKGLVVDWTTLYMNDNGQAELPQRISLPTYPFDRKRYWLTETSASPLLTPPVPATVTVTDETVNAGKKKTAALKEEEPFKLMTFEETWQEKPLEASQNGHLVESFKTLVCFSSDASCQQAITTIIGQLSKETKVVFISATGESSGATAPQYVIAKAADAGLYQSVFNEIVATHGGIDAMVYCWPLEDAAYVKDYTTLVAILQGIGTGKIKTKKILLAGQWQQQHDQPDMARCYLESWIGFERSFKLVLPGVQLKAIYQELPVNKTTTIADWVPAIWAELNSPEKGAALYKQGKRYVYKVTPATLHNKTTRLKKGGTYLITGGLGSLGLLFARHLAAHYSANLILTGRSFMDMEKQEELQKLENLGGQAFYLQADVCHREAMQQGLEQAKDRFGYIDGVIHAAGVIGAQLFLDKTMQDFQKILAPKVSGTVVLDDLLKEEPLDYVCYFTSSSAILGDFGACDYSVANRFQMAFAAYRNQLEKQGLRKGKTIAINWPLWKEGGMDLNDDESTKMYLKSSGQRYLLTEEGIALFEQLIAQEPVQQLVLAGQETRIKRFLGLQPLQSLQPVKQEKPANDLVAMATTVTGQPVLHEMNVAQRLEWDLVDLVSKAQQIPKNELGISENLADLGFDSISLSTLALALTHHYGVEIAPAVFFGYSSIEKLKEYFLKEHSSVIEVLYRKLPVHEPA